MKKALLIIGSILLLAVIYVVYVMISSRGLSPEATAKITEGSFEGQVTYCRPYKKDRLIFGPESEGALVPYGVNWRTGANAATELTINQDVSIGNQNLAKGTYSIYTIPNADSWVVALNSDTGYWGAGLSDPYDPEHDVLRAEVPTQRLDSIAEQFEIRWQPKNDSTLHLQLFWDQTLVEVPVQLLK